uniref:Uncharacterized protein n=1 Tax=Anguilla anguilla TaxID=7936 RepID=A0A0E9UPS6_ANGAN
MMRSVHSFNTGRTQVTHGSLHKCVCVFVYGCVYVCVYFWVYLCVRECVCMRVCVLARVG